MRGTLYLLAGLLCTAEGVYHFFTSSGQSGSFFGIKLAYVPFVGVQLVLGAFFLYSYFQERKRKLNL